MTINLINDQWSSSPPGLGSRDRPGAACAWLLTMCSTGGKVITMILMMIMMSMCMRHLGEGRVSDWAVSADGHWAEGGDEEVQEAPHDDGRGGRRRQHYEDLQASCQRNLLGFKSGESHQSASALLCVDWNPGADAFFLLEVQMQVVSFLRLWNLSWTLSCPCRFSEIYDACVGKCGGREGAKELWLFGKRQAFLETFFYSPLDLKFL